MTTVLDKVRRAIWEADPQNPPYDSLIPGRFSWNLADDQARAALLAVRDANEQMVIAGVWCGSDGAKVFAGDDEEQMRLAWKGIIDVILRERA